MDLIELAQRIGASVLAPPGRPVHVEQVYAGDRISDLLSHARPGVLLVSNLHGPQLFRLAELMDLPALCLVNSQSAAEGFVSSARAHGTGLLACSAGMFETCGRLYECLSRERNVT